MGKRILSAGVVVVHHAAGTCQYLLLRAYRHWDFPKGIVEPGEQPLAAACREVQEETSLVGLDFRWGSDYIETGPYAHGKVARYYLAETRDTHVFLPVSAQLGRPEHDEYRWVTYREARPLLSGRVLPVLEWAAERMGCGRAA